jgi:predicted RNA-binding Zn ribbon-like protein
MTYDGDAAARTARATSGAPDPAARTAPSPAGRAPVPRLTGEPLGLDLINTRWGDTPHHCDLLETPAGLPQWLASSPLAGEFAAGAIPLGQASWRATVRTRDVLARLAADPHDARARAAFDALLSHGRIRRSYTAAGSQDRAEVADPAWRAGWLAADDYLRLLEGGPQRIRRCAEPRCGQYFHDTSPGGGRRRWCSAAVCGNRARVARHYARHRADIRAAVAGARSRSG